MVNHAYFSRISSWLFFATFEDADGRAYQRYAIHIELECLDVGLEERIPRNVHISDQIAAKNTAPYECR